jgi:hypothetical protein
MRRAAHIDQNQPAIVEALEAVGCTVKSTAGVGDGFPDLIVGKAGETYLMEVKNPNQPPNKRKLRPGQQKFRDWWRGSPVHVVHSVEEALAVVAPEMPTVPGWSGKTYFEVIGDV